MKTVLFCVNSYSFGILEPIMKVLKERNYEYIWFAKDQIKDDFPFQKETVTSIVEEISNFQSEAIFVPGNEVPYYLKGVKVQVFHGLAGEKKGHFRIRHYFDLYLTQGPYFTKKFNQLKNKHRDFEVVETGWPKLDVYGKELNKYDEQKKHLLKKFSTKKIILYAPTFSPSLTSAAYLLGEFEKLSMNSEYLILFKFHDLMSSDLIYEYKALAKEKSNVVFEEERNIIKFLLMADIMISDTSSVVYEFLLLNKPVITFKSNSENIQWDNSLEYKGLSDKVLSNLETDRYKEKRVRIFNDYHPYSDGRSAERMVDAVEDYIEINGVPEKRNLSWLRRRKMNKIFGKL